MTKTKTISLFIAVILCITAFSSCSNGKKRYEAAFYDVFDTVSQFTAYCKSEKEFKEAKEAVHSELQRLHKLFDIYHKYEDVTNLALINENAGKEALKTGDDLAELIKLSREAYDFSDGKLNVALGSVLKLWHDRRESGEGIPSEEELTNAASHCDINGIILQSGTLYINDPLSSIDVGATAKGYAAKKAAEKAKEYGVTDFALNVGGNVVTSGKKPDGKWKIGIEDPNGGVFTTVNVSDECVVTSGDYQRYYEFEGKRYCHIIDTETLFPADRFRSVTVICKDSALADALSTSLFCLPLDKGKALAEKYGAEALWINADGSAERTKGFADYE